MNDLQMVNGVASFLCAVVLSGVVLSDRVKDGVVVKAGLIAMISSFIVTAMLTFENSRDWESYAHAHLINRVGILVVCGGILWRLRAFVRRPKKKSEAHSQRTNQLLGQINDPASDLMDLLIETKEKEEHGRTKV